MGFLKPKWGKIFFNAKGGQEDKLSVVHFDKIVRDGRRAGKGSTQINPLHRHGQQQK